MLGIAALALLPLALGQNVPLPATGDNGKVGGIFGLAGGAPGKGAGAPSLAGLTTKGKESPTTTKRVRDFGSGKYKAKYFADPSLPNHTIYAPKVAPIGVKLPVLVWGNGACMNTGTLFYDFLVEIASHGYLVVANGPPGKDVVEDGEVNIEPSAGLLGAQGSGQSKPSQLTESVHWVVKGGAAKYGDIDTAKIAAAGQSCGGLEAYSASYHDDRVKLTMLFNSGVISEDQKKLLKELKAPVGYFLGGPKDAAYANVSITACDIELRVSHFSIGCK